MKKIGIFLASTFIITWTIVFIIMFNGGATNPLYTVGLVVCMLVPAISVLITCIITNEGFKGVWIKPNFKGNLKYYLIAWLSPVILIIFGAIIYFLLNPSHFDANMTFIISSTKDKLLSLGQTVPSDEKLRSMLLIQVGTSIFIAPIINFIPALGEELGWRGYLLPRLCEKYKPIIAVIISGAIWGVWHAPMIAMGHNYGLGYRFAPIGGILAMIVFCIFVGAIFSYVSLKSKSAIPAAIGHGMLNGFAGIGVMFTNVATNNFIGPLPMGIIGGLGFIIAGTICLVLLRGENIISDSI